MNARRCAALATLLAALALSPSASAHEARPAYLEITETAPGRYDLLWKTPVLSGARLPVALRLPDDVRDAVAPSQREVPGALLERRVVEVPGGLAGRRIEFAGLAATITDVLVRMQLLDGAHTTTLVRPSQPWIEIAAAPSTLAVVATFATHGFEHILFGIDHLLFILALVLIVPSARVLFVTITAFTLAHSITLALATLGVVRVPGPPVDALVALSIMLLAVELLRVQAGDTSLTARQPWLVAFAFGLLHGFGFASALVDVGLPQADVPLALFAFNVGVEAGQLAFIAAVLAFLAGVRRMDLPGAVRRHTPRVAAYAIGTLAAFWFFERVARFLG